MLKTKYALSALGLLVAMTMATDALAQGVFSVSGSNQPRARQNGHTELAGGITLSRAAQPTNQLAGGTVMIDYGAMITNTVSGEVDSAQPPDTIDVQICATEGDSTNTNLVGSTLTITVAAGQCDAGSAINIDGVLLGIADSGLTTVNASISSSGDIRLGSGANDIPIVRNVVEEIGGFQRQGCA